MCYLSSDYENNNKLAKNPKFFVYMINVNIELLFLCYSKHLFSIYFKSIFPLNFSYLSLPNFIL